MYKIYSAPLYWWKLSLLPLPHSINKRFFDTLGLFPFFLRYNAVGILLPTTLPQTPWHTPFTHHWSDSCRTDSPKCKYLFKGHAFKIFIAVYREVNSCRGCSNHAISQGLWPPDSPHSCQPWKLLSFESFANVTDEEGCLMTNVVWFSLAAYESEQILLSLVGNLDSFLRELSVSVFGQLFSNV